MRPLRHDAFVWFFALIALRCVFIYFPIEHISKQLIHIKPEFLLKLSLTVFLLNKIK